MKTKRLIAALGAGALVTAGGVLAFAIPANAAAGDDVTATCTGLTVNLSGYAAEQPATDAVTHTEYQRYSYNPGHEKDGAPANDSTPLTDPAHWTANTANYQGAGHGTDPVGEVFQNNGNGNGDYFYWTATTVVDTPAQAAKANTVTVVIDGATVDTEQFGQTFDYTWTSPDQTVTHTFQVSVSDLNGGQVYSFTQTVDAAACATTPTDEPSTTPTDDPATPTDEPSTTPMDDPSTTPTDDPSTTPSGDSTTPASAVVPLASDPTSTTPAAAADQLAQTGSDIPFAAIAAPIGAALVGAMVIVISALRRRRASGAQD